jgi:hypothetical protein
MAAIVDLVKTLVWASIVVCGLWYFRNELKTALKRITAIGISEVKFDSAVGRC